MSRHRAVLVSAITATVLPAFCAYASDEPQAPRTEPAGVLPQQFRPALPQQSAAPAVNPGSRSPGLRFEGEAVPSSPSSFSFSRDNNLQYGLTSGAGSGSALNIAPAAAAPRTGWQFSGRVGPLRWLTPLDGEGETKMRFGGRVPGQPRMPGMGLFNVGVHYTFE